MPLRCLLGLTVVLAGVLATACGGAKAPADPAASSDNKAPDKPAAPSKDWEAEYREVKAKLDKAPSPLPESSLVELSGRLRGVVEGAKDAHLRANACILAASMYDARKDYPTALSYYRQAIALVPQEPSGYALSALTLAKMKRFDQAILMQRELVRRDPDDLQGWLILGELNTRANHPDRAAKAYAAYETRRTGLLEGLTRKKAKGVYALSPEHRSQCVHALAAAPDAGTSLALIYALQHDPQAQVRAAIVEVMAEQRFAGYLRPLQEWKSKESDPKIALRIDAAIKAIQADPVKTRPEPGDIAQPGAAKAVVDPQGKDAKPAKSAP